MKTKIQTLLMVLILSTSIINAATIYVDHNASGNNDGSTWADAYTIMQDALDASSTGDEIWVAKGVYLPTTKVGGTSDRTRAFQMLEGVSIYGGFAGTEASISERIDYSYAGANETILSGDFNDDDVITGSGATLAISNNAENSYHVFYHPIGYTLTVSTIIDGFTIKGGYANGSANPWNDGGGIYNYGGQSPTINNCYFTGNEAKDNGGGIVNANSSNATITNCSFVKNLSGVGTTEGGGAGMINYQSSPQITNCLFYGNRVSGGTNDLGGAIYNNNASNPTITNSTIVGNYARSGGGIYNADNSDATVINCIIWGNTIGSGVGTQIRNYTNSNLSLSYSDIEGGIAGGIYSSSGGSTIDGGGNIDSDPKFVGSSLNANHPFSIWGDSPCADVGSDAANSESYDIRGSDFGRKLSKTDGTSGTIDLGAYEFKYNSDPILSGRYYVNHDATGNNNGTNWTNAFTSFQSALDIAVADDEIWVARGTYKPSQEIDGTTDTPRKYAFQMINGVTIYGGFTGTETAVNERTDYGLGGANETILSGDIGIIDDISDNCYHVFYHPSGTNLDATAILDGFTVSDGNADAQYSNIGGGMRNYQSSPTIRNCAFTHNRTNYGTGSGGGMHNYYSSPIITNCKFLDNWSSYHGGAMSNDNASPIITNCTFSGNYANYYAGGIKNRYSSSPIIKNTVISNNSSNYGAGITNSDNSSPVITNCTISSNSALNGSGGGMRNEASSNPTITNSVFWGNTATTGAKEISNNGGSTPVFAYSDIEGSGGSSSWDTGLGTDGGNSIDAYPVFVGSSVNAGHPYSIYGNSPCADVGDNTANTETTDIRRGSYGRKLNKIDGSAGTIDMGAYEYKFGVDPAYPPIIFVDGTATGNDNGISWPDAYTSFQSALNEAVAGQEIWVAKGTYKPSQEKDGTTDTPRRFTFFISKNIPIYGGFSGSETSISQRTNYGSNEVNETILSGDIQIQNTHTDNCYNVVLIDADAGDNMILNGFTIKYGYADGSSGNDRGAGIYYDGWNESGSGSMTFEGCYISGNYARQPGSALFIGTAYSGNTFNITVNKCIFENNSSQNNSYEAVKIDVGSSSVQNTTIKNSQIINNNCPGLSISTYGGTGNFEVVNCLVYNNLGGIMNSCSSGSLTTQFVNTSIVNNDNESKGFVFCGIYESYTGGTWNIDYINCIVQGNINQTGSESRDGNYYSSNALDTEFNYSLLGLSGGSTAWDVPNAIDGGNNIDADPLFVGSGDYPFLIYGNSPCADAGSNIANAETTDIRGGSYGRKLSKVNGSAGTIDMGAYEYKYGTDPAADGIIITWGGSTDTDWNTASNWSSNTIPTSIDNVIIPDVVNDPVIAASASGDCNDMTIESGASLTIESGASGTATLITNGTITNNGTINAQRWFSGNDLNWHLASSPISNATTNVFYNMYLQGFSEASNSYNEITDETTPMNVMEGYALYSTLNVNNTVTFTGDLNTGSMGRGFTADNLGWNLMGNPYPSSIDWESVAIPAGMGNELQYLEASTGNWLSYVQGVGGMGSQYIPPMQGFFVKATAGGTFALENADRSHNGSNIFYKSENPNLLILSVSNETYSDETWIHFNENAGEGYDGLYDAHKMISTANPELPQIYSITPFNEMLSINGLPQTETMALGFTAVISGTFTINASKLMESSGIMLEDLKTGEFTDLTKNAYVFSYSIGENPERFLLHFSALGFGENGLESVNIYSSGKDIYVSVPENTNGNISVYNVTGQQVTASVLNGMNNKVSVDQSGIYIVMLNSKKKTIAKKVFVK